MVSLNQMPNGSGDSQLVALVHDVRKELRALDAMLRGNGGPGVLEQARANRAAIEALTEDVRALSRPAGDREKTARMRWRAVAEIVVAIAAILGSVLGIMQLMLGG